MNNNKVSNPKTEVPTTQEMNDRDSLNTLLEIEKNMSDNLSIALNEASNEKLFEDLWKMFEETKKMARELYNLMFQKGWYSLEKSEEQKITQCLNELEGKVTELI